MDFAFAEFGQIPHGLQRVQAICDWVHEHVEYRWGSGSPHTAASEVLAQQIRHLPRLRACGHRTVPVFQSTRALRH